MAGLNGFLLRAKEKKKKKGGELKATFCQITFHLLIKYLRKHTSGS